MDDFEGNYISIYSITDAHQEFKLLINEGSGDNSTWKEVIFRNYYKLNIDNLFELRQKEIKEKDTEECYLIELIDSDLKDNFDIEVKHFVLKTINFHIDVICSKEPIISETGLPELRPVGFGLYSGPPIDRDKNDYED